MKTRGACRGVRWGWFWKVRQGDRQQRLLPCLRRLGPEVLEERRVLSGASFSVPIEGMDLPGSLICGSSLAADIGTWGETGRFTADVDGGHQAKDSFVVSTLVDENDGDFRAGNLSLREALWLAAAQGGDDVIQFEDVLSGGTITLDPLLGQLAIDGNVAIQGPAAGRVTVDAAENHRVFEIHTGVVASISGLTVTGGGGVESGGGLYNRGTLTITNTTISGNSVFAEGPGSPAQAQGAGILNKGTLTITGSTISGNSASADRPSGTAYARGGGVYSVGALTIADSTVSGNSVDADAPSGSADAHGGGVYSEGALTITGTTIAGNSLSADQAGKNMYGGGVFSLGTLTIANSTISANTIAAFRPGGTADARGGGVYSEGTATIVNTAISGNVVSADASGGTAAARGGGVCSEGTATIVNTAISGNPVSADAPSGTADAHGGGVCSPGDLTITNSTISGNSATADPAGSSRIAYGGGIYVQGIVAETLHNTIVAGNDAENGGKDVFGSFDPASSYNLIGILDYSRGLGGAGTLYGTEHLPLDPRLGPLQDNGGPTWTHALLSDSPAIDAGSNDRAVEAGLNHDQRGFRRFLDADGDGAATVDIGAYEYGARAPLVVSTDQDEDDGDYGPADLSLREALVLAGQMPFIDAILFDDSLVDRSITLDPALGPLNVDSDVEVLGLGARRLTIDAAGEGRVFSVSAGVGATISAMTITGGSADFRGGGIVNAGTLVLSKVMVSGNSADTDGGGIHNTGTLTIEDATISGNRAGISGNRAGGGSGGGIYNAGPLTLVNSTICENSAQGAHGGGIANVGGTLAMINSTICANSAQDSGGGIYRQAGTASLHNTIVAGNFSHGGASHDVAGAFDPLSSHNLVGVIDGATGLDGTGALYGTAGSPLDAMLGPLADNAGPTLTAALLRGSPAIEAGSNARADDAGLTHDQRGLGRFFDADGDFISTVDMGAYESYVDEGAPVAALTAVADMVRPSGTPQRMDVEFADNVGMDLSTFDDRDLYVTGPGGYGEYAAAIAVADPAGGARCRVTYEVPATGGVWDGDDDGTYLIALQGDQVADTSGNFAPAAVLGTFTVSIGDLWPDPQPLQAVDPPGSLIYQSSVAGSIALSGEIDRLTIGLDDHQTVTLVVDPQQALQPTVELWDPGETSIGSAAAAAAGEEAVLQVVPTTGAGTYTVIVSGAAGSAGSYAVRLILGAAVEEESHGGPANDDPASAQDLDVGFAALGPGSAQRTAALGTAAGSEDWYRFTLEDHQSATLALNGSTPEGISLELYDNGGNRLAVAAAADNVHQVINDFVDTTSDGAPQVYRARVVGRDASDYSLVIAREAAFDTEPNGSLDMGQVLPSTGVVLGHLRMPDVQAEDPKATTGKAQRHAPSQPQGRAEPIIGKAEYVPGRLIVRYEGSATDKDRAKLLAIGGGTVTEELPSINGAVVELSDAKADVAAVAAAWSSHPAVRYAEPDYLVHILETFPDDPSFSSLWGMHNVGQNDGTLDADIDAPEAWDIFTGSSSVVVANIDTGVDFQHPDLAANMWVNPGEVPGDQVDNDGNGYVDDVYGIDTCNDDSDPMDDHRHGTHTAGTIGAVGNNSLGVVGVNWNVRIMALKPFARSGYAQTSDIIECIEYMVMMKTDYGVNVVVSNNSWGGDEGSEALKEAIGVSNDAGILFVAAAGNNGMDTDVWPHEPSSYDLDGIISVAASDRNDQLAYFSNYGAETVDLAAPGVSILSTTPENEYRGMSGTSMATPHVAGAVALLAAAKPDASPAELKAAILAGVDPLPQFSDVTVSGGRLNLFAVLTATEDPHDGYRVAAHLGDTLRIETRTPGVGPYEFGNLLDPAIELYDPDGRLLAADDNSAPDGRNALLTHQAAAAGTYTVRVIPGAVCSGEYVLSISGHHGEPPTFEVSATDPAHGIHVPSAPQMVVNFNHTLLLTTLEPSDLMVGELPATGATVVDHDTVAFDLPELPQGLHQVTIAGGALRDIQGNPILAYEGTLTVDWTAPRVVASSLLEGQVLPTGPLTYMAQFDEELRASNVDVTGVELRGQWSGTHVPLTLEYDPTGSMLRLRFDDLPDDAYHLTLQSGDGKLEDRAGNDLDGEAHPVSTVPSGDGNPGGSFVVSLSVDQQVPALPLRLTPMEPLGSMVYGCSLSAAITTPDDVDGYVLQVEHGQVITVWVDPYPTLQPTISLSGPDGSLIGTATAAAAGTDALLQLVPTTGAGTYTATVAGSSGTGAYHVQLALGAMAEEENHDGPTNDDAASAQDLDVGLVTLAADRGQRSAVLGKLTAREDWYRFTLDDGQPATLALAAATPNDWGLDLYDADLQRLTTGTPAANLASVIESFVDLTTDASADTYFVRVTSSVQSDYTLLVTRSAGFEVEPNHGPGPEVQEITASNVLSHLGFTVNDAVHEQRLISPTAVVEFGCSVDIDGDRAIVGAYKTDRVYFLRRDDGIWSIEQELYNRPARFFGFDVSISGNTAVVAAESQATHVYQYDGSEWRLQQTFPGPTRSVEVSGNTIMAGSEGEDSEQYPVSSTVYVFQFDGLRWVQTPRLDIRQLGGRNYLECNVAIDGDWAFVGAKEALLAPRAGYTVFVFRRDGDQWVFHQRIVPESPVPEKFRSVWHKFRMGVDVSGDAAIVSLVEQDGVGRFAGTASIYRFDGSQWIEQQKLLPAGVHGRDQYGYSASLDGDTAVVGARFDDDAKLNAGAVYVFRRDGGQWILQHKLTASEAAAEAGFGRSVAIDGNHLIVGTQETINDPGTVHLFRLLPTHDDYAIGVRAGDPLVISTTTPGDAPGEPGNFCDPAVELYGPGGTLVASDDNGAADGRNAQLRHTAAESGRYMVRVLPGAPSTGAYSLSVLGNSGDLPFAVAATDPAPEGTLVDSLGQIVIDFNDAPLLTTLDASDFTFDGLPVTTISLLDADTLILDLPAGLAGGLRELNVAAGAILDVQGTPIEPFSAVFPVGAAVTGRHVFYNNSAFDGNKAQATAWDDAAIATDKVALRPGQTATFANYTSYSRGINGIMVDVAGLPEGALLTGDDFLFYAGNDDNPNRWNAAAAPASITLRPGQGIHGSDRVTLIWEDGAVAGQWLQVTVLATAHTGLVEDDVFYFGNAIGESGTSTTDAKVNSVDMLAARDNQRGFLDPAPIDFFVDYNRDARVNAIDMLTARNNQTHLLNALKLITVPGKNAAGTPAEGREESSYDAIFSQAAGRQPPDRKGPSAKLDWLYELEPATVVQRTSERRDSPAAELPASHPTYF